MQLKGQEKSKLSWNQIKRKEKTAVTMLWQEQGRFSLEWDWFRMIMKAKVRNIHPYAHMHI